jgi:hypothetical protein
VLSLVKALLFLPARHRSAWRAYLSAVSPFITRCLWPGVALWFGAGGTIFGGGFGDTGDFLGYCCWLSGGMGNRYRSRDARLQLVASPVIGRSVRSASYPCCRRLTRRSTRTSRVRGCAPAAVRRLAWSVSRRESSRVTGATNRFSRISGPRPCRR